MEFAITLPPIIMWECFNKLFPSVLYIRKETKNHQNQDNHLNVFTNIPL